MFSLLSSSGLLEQKQYYKIIAPIIQLLLCADKVPSVLQALPHWSSQPFYFIGFYAFGNLGNAFKLYNPELKADPQVNNFNHYCLLPVNAYTLIEILNISSDINSISGSFCCILRKSTYFPEY